MLFKPIMQSDMGDFSPVVCKISSPAKCICNPVTLLCSVPTLSVQRDASSLRWLCWDGSYIQEAVNYPASPYPRSLSQAIPPSQRGRQGWYPWQVCLGWHTMLKPSFVGQHKILKSPLLDIEFTTERRDLSSCIWAWWASNSSALEQCSHHFCLDETACCDKPSGISGLWSTYSCIRCVKLRCLFDSSSLLWNILRLHPQSQWGTASDWLGPAVWQQEKKVACTESLWMFPWEPHVNTTV